MGVEEIKYAQMTFAAHGLYEMQEIGNRRASCPGHRPCVFNEGNALGRIELSFSDGRELLETLRRIRDPVIAFCVTIGENPCRTGVQRQRLLAFGNYGT